MRKKSPPIKKRLWIFQTNLSGNANGHFETILLPVNSKKADVYRAVNYWAMKVFNIRDLGVFTSKIPNKDFCPDNIGTKIPKQYEKSN